MIEESDVPLDFDSLTYFFSALSDSPSWSKLDFVNDELFMKAAMVLQDDEDYSSKYRLLDCKTFLIRTVLLNEGLFSYLHVSDIPQLSLASKNN